MKKGLKIVLSVVVWAAILCYIVWSVRLGRSQREQVRVRSVRVSVEDSTSVDIIRGGMVLEWLVEGGLWPVGEKIGEVDTRAINEYVEEHDFVSGSKTYIDLEGTLSIDLRQREPLVRFINDSGYNFYVTADGYVIPSGVRTAHYVPVVTGNFGLPFDKTFSGNLNDVPVAEEKKSDKNHTFLTNLINFVKYIESNDFWSSQIVQINVTNAPESRTNTPSASRREPEPQIEIIPRVGDHVILLGSLDGYGAKLDRLMKFYKGAVMREGWNKWNHINLKYDNQIVCSNK